MNITRTIAATAAVAALAATTLLTSGAATAAPGTDYVVASQLTATETSPYSPGWFTGGGSTGAPAPTSTLGGLVLNGRYQILNGTTPTTGLTALALDAEIGSSAGNPSIQIPVFTTPSAGTPGYTTIYADEAGIASNTWFTSAAFGTFTALSSHTIEDLEAEMDSDYEILAFGFFTPAATTATVTYVQWDEHDYVFTPTPVSAGTPATLTAAAFASTGVTFTTSGFVPGEVVTPGLSAPNSGGTLPDVVADASGSVTYTLVGTAPADLGAYTLSLTGSVLASQRSFDFTVTADVAAAVPGTGDTLAATGTDAATGILAAGVLLISGAAVFVLRRRALARS